MRAALLTVEQSRVVADLLGVVDDQLGIVLWDRLHVRLCRDQEEGVVRPPARLRELLQRWLIEADPDGYADRRRDAAEDCADVELWRQDNGLVDLVTRSLTAADAQACADRYADGITASSSSAGSAPPRRRQGRWTAPPAAPGPAPANTAVGPNSTALAPPT